MSKGGSKTTTQSQSTQIDPAYLSKWNDLYSGAQNAVDSMGNPYNSYTGELTAGFTGGQNQAYNAAGTNATNAQGLNAYGLLGSLMGQNAGTIGGTDLSQYMNPYTQSVIDASLSDIDRSRQLAQQGVSDQAIAAGAYGGDRQGVAEAETNRAYAQQAANTAANLRQQAYNNAQNMAQQDVANRQNTINSLSSLAGQGIGAQNSALSQLYQIGSGLQNTNQNVDTANYQQYLNAAFLPQQNQTYLANILKAMPYNTSTTGTTTQQNSGSLMNTLLGVGSMIAGVPGAGNAIGGLLGLGGGSAGLDYDIGQMVGSNKSIFG